MWRLLQLAACAPALALSALAQTPTKSPNMPLVGVYLEFDHVPEGVSVNAMERSVETLLKPAGVALAWRQIRENAGKEAFSRLAVLKFKGRCDLRAPRVASKFGSLGETTALAFTEISRGRVLPYTEVECDEVRKALAYVRPGAGALENENAFGLALGRVVAHELYHILANSVAHAGNGLAKASELLSDLVSTRDLRFDAAAARAIRNGIRAEK
jgi:hypothetical protein